MENREKWRKKTGCKSICGAPTTLAVKGLVDDDDDYGGGGGSVYRFR